MALAVYGKHPAKGDFVEHGVPAGLKPQLESWLDQVLAEARHGLGENWESVWRDARPIRFWLGGAIWGERVCGALMASVDRVGRRFPLVIFAFGADAERLAAPVVAAEHTWFSELEAHLRRVQRAETLVAPADLLSGAPQVPGEPNEPAPDDFWAVRPSEDVSGLWADVGLTDHSRASLGRSYWWVAGDPPLPAPVQADEPAEVPVEVAVSTEAEALPESPADAVEEAALPAQNEPAAAWEVPPEDDSPFASDSNTSTLFAAPEAADPLKSAEIQPLAFAPPPKPVVKQLWSQVWAGNGLPSGHVIAWFLRGYDGNG